MSADIIYHFSNSRKYRGTQHNALLASTTVPPTGRKYKPVAGALAWRRGVSRMTDVNTAAAAAPAADNTAAVNALKTPECMPSCMPSVPYLERFVHLHVPHVYRNVYDVSRTTIDGHVPSIGMARLCSVTGRKQVFGRHSPKCQPIWMKFGRDPLLHLSEYTCGFSMTQIGALAAPGQTIRTSVITVIPKISHNSGSPPCQWQTHKCLMGSGLCCREAFPEVSNVR